MTSISMRLARRRLASPHRWLRIVLRRWWPPLRRPEFWATQALVFVIAAGHVVLEMLEVPGLKHLNLVPVSLFLVPVIYSALNFGLRGAGPTAIWCGLLALPNIVFLHPGADRFAEIWQAGLVVVVGLVVGQRIDREQRARADAQRRERARRSSEERYRRLFESTADPIMLLRHGGTVEEANTAAAMLFGVARSDLAGRRLEDLADPELAIAVEAADPGSGSEEAVRLADSTGRMRWFEPVVADFEARPGRIQVVLRDVTAQQERQAGLEAYTRQTMAAREEERRRIARDLHDGPVQELVLLWRGLDELGESASGENRVRLADARALAERIANDLRRISRDLRPSLLDDLGLGPALNAECAAFSACSGIAARYVETGAPRRLATDIELMLLRIAQEALHNVDRHARARTATVRLTFRAGSVRLSVTDDGVGFSGSTDNRALLAEGKLGIVGMRERARLAGGELTLRSARNRRTTVSVLVPASRLAAVRPGGAA